MLTAICDISGIQFWRSEHPLALKKLHCHMDMPTELSAYVPLFPFEKYHITRPLHIMVIDQADRRLSTKAKYHVAQESMPPNSFVRINESLIVASPELCFVQAAQHLPFVQLVRVGFELCGTYPYEKTESGHRHRPSTTVKALKDFIAEAKGMFGTKKAKKALDHIIENSASPMETVSAMLLCLPPYLGGYGIPHPRLNHMIRLGSKNQKRSGKKSYRVDFFWPEAHLALEYDSNAHHTGADKIAADSIRRDIISAIHGMVLTLTWGQVCNVSEFDTMAHIVAKHLDYPMRIRRSDWKTKRNDLRSTLLGTNP